MKKIIFCLGLIAFAGVFSANAQEAEVKAAPNPNAADFKFDEDTHDYGTINHGADGTYFFKFKNVGKEPLIISNARGSCGCTVPEWPKEPIKPGGEGKIKVTYDTKRQGNFHKTVTITSNAKESNKVLTIKGNVLPAVAEETSPVKKASDGMPFEKN
jgi:hypothetical protein